MAASRAGVSGGRARSCRVRHSARLRAPTPVGSMFCRCLSAVCDLLGLELLDFGLQTGGDVLQRLGQETGIVQVVDQRGNQGSVAQRQRADDQLAQQVLAQG